MMMKCFTVETRLDKARIPIEYFMWNMHKQCHLFRIVYKLIQTSRLPESKLNTYLQKTYQVDKRTANSLINDAKGRLQSLKEIKNKEIYRLSTTIRTFESNIHKMICDLNRLKAKVTANIASATELKRYRLLKRTLWDKKQQLNRMKQKLQQYKNCLRKRIFPVCWGTKKLFKAQYHLKENGFKSHQGWLNAFRRKRDSQIYFVGSRSDRCGNQNCQLTYQKVNDTFTLKIRKDKEVTTNSTDIFYYIRGLQFKYHKQKLIETIIRQNTPFTFRFVRKQGKWYLQVIFTWIQDATNMIKNTTYGTIGLDYNVGFISMSETDYYGNLIDIKHFPLPHHGQGNIANSKLQEAIAEIVKIAKAKQKPIAIEKLDFQLQKSHIVKSYRKKGKSYNKMIHEFDYSRYLKSFQNACFRNNILLILINPAYTSQIGIAKYADRMKLNRHQAASYVIARKAQGFIDKFANK